MSIRDKFEIVEKPFQYVRNGEPKTDVKFDIINKRSGRRVARHITHDLAEAELVRMEAIKTSKRLARRNGGGK